MSQLAAGFMPAALALADKPGLQFKVMGLQSVLHAPSCLLAMPQLADTNFNRGVILILEHGDEGSMGLALNKPSSMLLKNFCASQDMALRGGRKGARGRVFRGGPVQEERAFILHDTQHEGPETENICEGVRLSFSLDSLRLLSEDPPERWRVFLGYAGWGPGQLASEVSAGAWLVVQPSQSLVFDAVPDTMWELALRQLGIEPVQLAHGATSHVIN